MLIHFLKNLLIHELLTICFLSGLLSASSVSLSPPPEEDQEPLAITRMVTSSLSSIAALASHSALGVQDLPHPDTPQGCKEAFQK